MLRKLLGQTCYRFGQTALTLGPWTEGQARWWFRLTRRWWPQHPEVGPWLDYLEGVRAFRQGNFNEAVSRLRNAVRHLPEVTGIHRHLGLSYGYLGRYDEAIGQLEKLLREAEVADDEEIWVALSWSYLRTGRAAVARETCQRASSVGVRSPRLELMYTLALGAGIGSLPVNRVREWLQQVPDMAPLLLEYARSQAREGRLKLAQCVVAAFPPANFERSYAIIALGSLNEDDPDTAEWAAEQIVSAGRPHFSTEVGLIRSEVAVRRGDYGRALSQLGQVAEMDVISGRVLEQAGRILLLAGQWEEAVDKMVEALHRGGAGALAAGIGALAAIEVEDLASARRAFGEERRGDALARAFAHTAQSRLLTESARWDEGLEVGQRALGELETLPPWASPPHVRQRLQDELRQALRTLAARATETEKAAAQRLLEKLTDLWQGQAADLSAKT
jgi:tetratricopeptide (TPR) repeat protein